MVLGGSLLAVPAFEVAKSFSNLVIADFLFSMVLVGLLWGVGALLIGRISQMSNLDSGGLIIDLLGEKVAQIPLFLLSLCLIFWFSISLEIMGELIFQINGISKTHSILGIGLVISLLSFMGVKTLEVVSSIASPLMFTVLLFMLTQVDWALLGTVEGKTIGFVSSMGIAFKIIPSLAIGILVYPDLAIYAKNHRAAQFSGAFSFGLIGPIVILACFLIVKLIPGNDWIAFGIDSMGKVVFSSFLILLAWTTNDNNLYFFGRSVSDIIKLSHKKIAVVGGVLGTSLAVFSPTKFIPGFFNLIWIFFLPILILIIIKNMTKINLSKKLATTLYFLTVLLSLAITAQS